MPNRQYYNQYVSFQRRPIEDYLYNPALGPDLVPQELALQRTLQPITVTNQEQRQLRESINRLTETINNQINTLSHVLQNTTNALSQSFQTAGQTYKTLTRLPVSPTYPYAPQPSENVAKQLLEERTLFGVFPRSFTGNIQLPVSPRSDMAFMQQMGFWRGFLSVTGAVRPTSIEPEEYREIGRKAIERQTEILPTTVAQFLTFGLATAWATQERRRRGFEWYLQEEGFRRLPGYEDLTAEQKRDLRRSAMQNIISLSQEYSANVPFPFHWQYRRIKEREFTEATAMGIATGVLKPTFDKEEMNRRTREFIADLEDIRKTFRVSVEEGVNIFAELVNGLGMSKDRIKVLNEKIKQVSRETGIERTALLELTEQLGSQYLQAGIRRPAEKALTTLREQLTWQQYLLAPEQPVEVRERMQERQAAYGGREGYALHMAQVEMQLRQTPFFQTAAITAGATGQPLSAGIRMLLMGNAGGTLGQLEPAQILKAIAAEKRGEGLEAQGINIVALAETTEMLQERVPAFKGLSKRDIATLVFGHEAGEMLLGIESSKQARGIVNVAETSQQIANRVKKYEETLKWYQKGPLAKISQPLSEKEQAEYRAALKAANPEADTEEKLEKAGIRGLYAQGLTTAQQLYDAMKMSPEVYKEKLAEIDQSIWAKIGFRAFAAERVLREDIKEAKKAEEEEKAKTEKSKPQDMVTILNNLTDTLTKLNNILDKNGVEGAAKNTNGFWV